MRTAPPPSSAPLLSSATPAYGGISFIELDLLDAAFRVPEGWLDTLDFEDRDKLKAQVLAEFANWDDSLRRLVADADGRFLPRKITQLPAPHTWPTVPGLTLLGDAAHLMSPFAGEGAIDWLLSVFGGKPDAAATADAANATDPNTIDDPP